MPNDEAYLAVLRADLKAKAQEGDILGATEVFGKAIEVSSRIAEEAQKEERLDGIDAIAILLQD